MRNVYLSIALILFSFSSADAAILFTEGFDTPLGGTYNGGQYDSGLPVAYGTSFSGWNHTGGNAIHIVDHDAGVADDYAVMAWQDQLTMQSSIPGSNQSGAVYDVSFDISPAVYQVGEQATIAGDRLSLEILRTDNSVLDTFYASPGPWAGDMDFTTVNFSYTGDGSGDVRIRVGFTDTTGGSTFDGAFDNITLSESETEAKAIPTLSIWGLGMLIGLFGLFGYRRRTN